MPTRLCPSCHRRIVATEIRCCYCGRESEIAGAQRGPAQVIGLDGTPREGGSVRQAIPSALTESTTAESGDGPCGPDGGSGNVASAYGFDVDGPGYNPPGAEGSLVEVSATPVHRWIVYPIVVVLILTVMSRAFPEGQAWIDPLRYVLSIASQYAVLCTPFRKWSMQLHLTAALPILLRSHSISPLDGPLYVLYIFTLYATAQAQAIGLWRYWRFRYPPPSKGQDPTAAKSSEPSAGKVA